MQDIARQQGIGTKRCIRICQVAAKQLVLVLHARAQQQRPLAVQPEAKSRKVTGALVIKALIRFAERAHITIQIEHGEAVAVLQNRNALRQPRYLREDVVLILELNDVFHERVRSRSSDPHMLTSWHWGRRADS